MHPFSMVAAFFCFHFVSARPQNAWKEYLLNEFGKPQSWSYAVDYGSGQSGPLSPSFNFCLEAQDNSKLIASYYHHLVVQRQVRNPFEGPEVIAITNYIDIGFEFQQSLAESASGSEAAGHELPAMQIGASWQANKNILLKGKLGTASSAVALLLKSWWQPSFTISLSAMRDHVLKDTRFGLGIQVENFGGARYEKADPTYVMVTPTKQHVAKEMMEKNPHVRPMLSTNVVSGVDDERTSICRGKCTTTQDDHQWRTYARPSDPFCSPSSLALVPTGGQLGGDPSVTILSTLGDLNEALVWSICCPISPQVVGLGF
ncbi:hypothetical protein L7F22_028880 [Adiantum nelumboides]|nr:hypothetical protein [Adiantum nelumboides]